MRTVVLAQAMVEHGLLDSMVASLAAARDRLEVYVGTGNAGYALAGVAAVVVLLLLWRR